MSFLSYPVLLLQSALLSLLCGHFLQADAHRFTEHLQTQSRDIQMDSSHQTSEGTSTYEKLSHLANSAHVIESVSSMAKKLMKLESESAARDLHGAGGPCLDEDLDKIVLMFWPHVSRMVEDLLINYLVPALHDLSPKLRSLKFSALNLGSDRPTVRLVDVVKAGGRDFRLTVSVDHRMTSRAELSLGPAKIGIENMHVSAEVVVRFDHLLDTLPLVGGIALQLADLPTLDYKLTGLGKVVGIPGLKGMIASAIDSVVADQLMGANQFAYAWSDSVDISALRHPMPAGMLQVTLGDGRSLASTLRLPRERKNRSVAATSINIRMGNEKRSLSMLNLSHFADDSATFTVWNEGQRIYASVQDTSVRIMPDSAERIETNRSLGEIQSIPVREALRLGEADLPLMGGEEGNGNLKLTFKMLHLVPFISGDVSMLKVHVDRLMLPYIFGSQSAKVVVQLGDQRLVTAAGSAQQEQRPAVAEELENVIRSMSANNLSTEKIAQILSMEDTLIDEVLRGGDSGNLHASHVEVMLDSILYLPLARSSLWDPEGTTVDISVIAPAKKGSAIASLSYNIKSLSFGETPPRKRAMANTKCSVSGFKYWPLNMKRQGRTKERSIDDCQQRCASVKDCAHFSYWPSVGAGGGCHLQDSNAHQKVDKYATCGPRRCLSVDAWIGLSLFGTKA